MSNQTLQQKHSNTVPEARPHPPLPIHHLWFLPLQFLHLQQLQEFLSDSQTTFRNYQKQVRHNGNLKHKWKKSELRAEVVRKL